MKNTLLVSLLLLSLFILPVNAQCVAPPSGLVSWWPGDGNALDIAGLNDGSFPAGTFAAGKVTSGTGEGFSLDGV